MREHVSRLLELERFVIMHITLWFNVVNKTVNGSALCVQLLLLLCYYNVSTFSHVIRVQSTKSVPFNTWNTIILTPLSLCSQNSDDIPVIMKIVPQITQRSYCRDKWKLF